MSAGTDGFKTIAFIGLGNMGGGMAANQAKAGREVIAFDLSEAALARAVAAGCEAASSAAEAVRQADAVITMLPAGPHVRSVYAEQVLPNVKPGAVLVDCSTIDVESARAVAAQVKAADCELVGVATDYVESAKLEALTAAIVAEPATSGRRWSRKPLSIDAYTEQSEPPDWLAVATALTRFPLRPAVSPDLQRPKFKRLRPTAKQCVVHSIASGIGLSEGCLDRSGLDSSSTRSSIPPSPRAPRNIKDASRNANPLIGSSDYGLQAARVRRLRETTESLRLSALMERVNLGSRKWS